MNGKTIGAVLAIVVALFVGAQLLPEIMTALTSVQADPNTDNFTMLPLLLKFLPVLAIGAIVAVFWSKNRK